tara:strand:- start:2653 stop:3231 length:579 start_codon:yes stop_codon:yes gene_type:complete
MNVLIVAATGSEISSEMIRDFPTLTTGVGMLNAAINLTKELHKKKYDLVINMGVAGSFSSEIKIGDVVEVTEDSFSEIGFEDGESFSEFSDFDIKDRFIVAARTSLRKVRAITVNTVHGNQNSIDNIIERLDPDIESMEGAAIFQVCDEMKIPCMQIRSISNKVEIRNKDNWQLDLAIRNLNLEIEKIIHSL